MLWTGLSASAQLLPVNRTFVLAQNRKGVRIQQLGLQCVLGRIFLRKVKAICITFSTDTWDSIRAFGTASISTNRSFFSPRINLGYPLSDMPY